MAFIRLEAFLAVVILRTQKVVQLLYYLIFHTKNIKKLFHDQISICIKSPKLAQLGNHLPGHLLYQVVIDSNFVVSVNQHFADHFIEVFHWHYSQPQRIDHVLSKRCLILCTHSFELNERCELREMFEVYSFIDLQSLEDTVSYFGCVVLEYSEVAFQAFWWDRIVFYGFDCFLDLELHFQRIHLVLSQVELLA